MKVVYTYHCLQQRIGGISRYFFEISQRIRKTDDVQVVSKYLNNQYFSEVIKGRNRDFLGDRKFLTKYYVRNFIEDMYMFRYLRGTDADVIHMTGESPWIFHFLHDNPIVITVHDMIPELTNDSRSRVCARRKCIEKADAIICVSENTRRDLLDIYPHINKEKVFVVYHGSDSQHASLSEVMPDDYILFVGNRGIYKNFNFALTAIAPILKSWQLRLVCTGHDLDESERALVASLGLEGKVDSAGFVSDSRLNELYRGARLFLFPSKYEGFGIPILESWANGCPLCLSNTSCFPEIAGDAASYFDPENAESIRAAVERILNDENYRRAIIERGHTRVAQFSWDIAAEKTLEVYRWVINHRNIKKVGC